MKELNELKALAYDMIATLEHIQRQLTETNQKIAEKTAELQQANDRHERGNLDIID